MNKESSKSSREKNHTEKIESYFRAGIRAKEEMVELLREIGPRYSFPKTERASDQK